VYPTTDDCCRVVHMEGSNVPGTSIDSTEAEKTKRLGLIDIEAKCRAHLIGRMWAQNLKKSSTTATLFREWNLDGPRANPPHIGRIHMTLDYLCRYALDISFIAPPPDMTKRLGLSKGAYTILHIQWRQRRENPEK